MFAELGIEAPMETYDGHKLLTVSPDFVVYEPWISKVQIQDGKVQTARLSICAELVEGRWEYFTSIKWLD